MAIEKERKFLLTELPSDLKFEVINIKQGYVLTKGDKQFRVRIIDDKKASIAYKYKIDLVSKAEFEYDIPLEDGLNIYNSCTFKLEKKRYKSKIDNITVDIDFYMGSNIPPVVEIEYEGELTNIPSFCGEEVTGKKKYSNIQIAKMLSSKK